MPYPTPPEIATNYSAQEQALGDGSLPGQELDVDLAAIRASATAVIEFLKGIARSDGKLANGIVTKESLASSLVIGFDPPAPWASGTAYTTSSTVFSGFGFYLCVTAHTSTVFATDLASGRWVLLADLTPPGGALIAANNLNDVPDKANARSNLGLGTMATASASAYRTNTENDAVYQAILTGLTASVAELNRLTGVTTTATELNRVAGVTSPIQSQLNGKQNEVLTTNGDIVVRSGGATTRLGLGANGQAPRSNGSALVYDGLGYTWASAVTTNGASVYDVASIPSWATEIICLFEAVSLATKTDSSLIRIGTGGSPAATGYNVNNVAMATGVIVANETTGFLIGASNDDINGVLRLTRRAGSNVWTGDGMIRRTSATPSAALALFSGVIGLAGSLDVVRLIRSGAGNYNGGTFAVGWK